MPAHYDTYDYPLYWKGREYEHTAEVIALKSFLEKLPRISTIADVGAGYGRLTPTYLHRARRIILADPSAKLLKIARQNIKDKRVKFIQSKIESLGRKIRKGSCDLVILVRVLHHIEDPNLTLSIINRILSPGGHLIIEFANKQHLKAIITNFARGNVTFPFEIFPKDIRCAKNILRKTLPFKNYHPDFIKGLLSENKFKIIETRSVSNIRSNFLKKFLSLETLLTIEKHLQKPLAYVNFGPSIFILAKKRG